jgi:F-type H+-transporting ATPase subunit a
MIFFLSLSIGIGTFITGLKIHGMKYFFLFIPDCPFLLLPFLIVIELFSYVIRSFSLAIRLSANIMAGHTLVHIISSFILKVSSISTIFFALLLAPILAVLMLELGVAFLQAYVFVTLVSIYLSDSIHLNH